MLRRSFLLTVAGMAATVALTSGQAKRVDGFTATLTNIADTTATTVTVDLLRWSTDAERDRLTGLMAKGESELLTALKGAETVGYIWTGESVGYPVRYAYRQMLPDGTERIVLMTDRPFGTYSTKLWTARAPAQTQRYPFAAIEIRLPKGRAGDGKLSLAAKIVVDAEAKTIALDNYAAAPAGLRNVRRVPTS